MPNKADATHQEQRYDYCQSKIINTFKVARPGYEDLKK